MGRMSFAVLLLGMVVGLQAQGQVAIKEGMSFWYVSMEFPGPHYEGLSEKFGLFIQELRKQELLPKISGDSFCIFFDSPFLAVERDTVWGLGFEIQKDADVELPLKKREYTYPRLATVINRGPYETVGNAYNVIIAYIEENGLEVIGPPVEIWHGNPREDEPEDLSSEILMPIREIKK